MNKNTAFFTLFMFFLMGKVFASFPDIENHVYQDSIKNVFDQGIVAGYPDGTFRPDSSINRAEFVKILVESRFEEEAKDRERLNLFCFEDLKDSIEWYSGYVCLAKEKQIITGYPDQTFRPSVFVNRAEAAKILYQSYFESVSETETPGPWYQIYLDLLEEKGLLFEPFSNTLDAPLTRGEMSFLVDELNRYLNNKSDQESGVDLEEGIFPPSQEADEMETEEELPAQEEITEIPQEETIPEDSPMRISPFEVFTSPHPGQLVTGGYIVNYSQWEQADYQPSLANHVLSDEEEKELQGKVIESVNQARIEAGQPALLQNELLQEISQQFAEHLVVNAVYSHSDMLGQDPFDRAKKIGYSGYVSESMVWRKSSVETAIDWWRSSSLHWKNIVGDRFKNIGVGVTQEPNGGYMVILLTGE